MSQCNKEMRVVRDLVARYHGDWLGDWTWVLVKADDWKPLKRRLHGDPDSPAFSALDQRETFFDEALFEVHPTRAELLKTWQMPIDRLAILAVTHEIGHAMCNDTSEARANKRAEQLQAGSSPDCGEKQLRADKR